MRTVKEGNIIANYSYRSVALHDHMNTIQWLLYHYWLVELFDIATDQWSRSLLLNGLYLKLHKQASSQ